MLGGAAVLIALGGYFVLGAAGGDDTAAAWQEYAPEAETGLNVVIFGEKPNETPEDMGDWADYLNDFTGADPTVAVAFESMDKCMTLLVEDTLCGEPSSTLFLNSEGRALFYDGIIVEPQVYDHAGAALRGGEITPMMRAFAADTVSLK